MPEGGKGGLRRLGRLGCAAIDGLLVCHMADVDVGCEHASDVSSYADLELTRK